MKPISPANEMSMVRRRRAFTLIEMLVVIAIIGILAAMIVPLSALVAKKRILSRAKSDISSLEAAIDAYKTKKGYYPPDNTTTPAGAYTNQLFYELWGMVWNPTQKVFTNTYNANETISTSTLGAYFGVSSINNSSADTSDIINFIPRIRADRIQNIGTATAPVWVFVNPANGPANGLPMANGQPVNVIRYVSSNPTNNPNTYDLWIDLLIGGKTNRVSNWSTEAEIVGQ